MRVLAIVLTMILLQPVAAMAFDAATLAAIRAGQADCVDCDLTGADLEFECVKTGDLSGARFDGANMKYMCMRETKLVGTSFRNADMTGANLSDAVLTDADLTGTILNTTLIRGTDLSHAKGLTQAQVSLACGDDRTKLPAGFAVNICS